jgi:hypothetical protein
VLPISPRIIKEEAFWRLLLLALLLLLGVVVAVVVFVVSVAEDMFSGP